MEMQVINVGKVALEKVFEHKEFSSTDTKSH